MKTYSLYGFYTALASMVLTLAIYFLGYHSDPAKFSTGQIIGSVGGLAIGITFIVLGTKARRAEWPVAEDFTYGNAFVAGFMTMFCAGVIGIVTNYLYFQVINPGIADVIVQAQLDKLEAKGLSGAQLEGAEKSIRFFMKPGITAAVGFISALFWGAIISLVTSAFLKRPAVEEIKEETAAS
ncbi:MAG TPA: DUF4199 domain-containing protein [Opitutaceae bacterium]|nr:DUF4199 domain-containing protein [Opitutaceae bacterium]HND59967.1 DUF4199 domain-containing protein [Opitutaceae bacterium]